jgi:hypothetical protein
MDIENLGPVGPGDVLILRGIEDFGDDQREAFSELTKHTECVAIVLFGDATVEKLDEHQMNAAGWYRKVPDGK